jgi:hypothetical protein
MKWKRFFLKSSKPPANQQTKPQKKMTTTATKNAIEIIKNSPAKSAWQKGVKEYALELLEELEGDYAAAKLLNGAENWKAYSCGGCSLTYDADIAERLCSPSELKRTKGGERQPNSSETWLDAQARALSQAVRMIAKAFAA